MNNGICALSFAGIAMSLMMSAGCDYKVEKHEPPANSAISQVVGDMYLTAGIVSEVSSATILGKHYRPAQDSWKMAACVEFITTESVAGRDCNDSFELYRMDSGVWMLNGTVNGGYLWLQIP